EIAREFEGQCPAAKRWVTGIEAAVERRPGEINMQRSRWAKREEISDIERPAEGHRNIRQKVDARLFHVRMKRRGKNFRRENSESRNAELVNVDRCREFWN